MERAVVERGRDLRLDFLRGVFVLGMIVDHVGGASWLYAITGGNRFYASAAEGFVFVSGLVAGRAYTRMIQRDGLSAGLGRLLNRAGQLYLLAIALALTFAPISETLHLPWAMNWNLHDSPAFVVSVLTLHRTYYLVDVMVLYVLALVSATVAFVLLVRGQSALVLAGSWLLWLAYQLFPDQASVPWPIAGNNLFNFAAWQVLFFTGLTIGFHWERQTLPLVGAVNRWRGHALAIGAVALGVLVAVHVLEAVVFSESQRAWWLTAVFGKSDLRAGRLIAFGIVFVVIFAATTEWWPHLRAWAGWLVLPLGQNALFAYAAHAVFAVAAVLALERVGGVDAAPAGLNTGVQIASIGAIWLLVQRRSVRAVFSVPRVRVALPAAFALLALAALPRVQPSAPDVPAVAGAQVSRADEQVARAYGTAIPADTQPALPAAASAPPVPQPPAQPAMLQQVSNAAGPITGTLLEPEFDSAAMNTPERYFIYLPPNYQSGKRFPVLYMLHGGGGRREWINYDLIGAADRAISRGQIPPMLIVLPQGDQGYWVNHVNGPQWGDYTSRDLVQHIDSTYPTLPDAAHRAIGGLSMGGWGALYQAFSHPDEFGVVGSHAGALRGDDGSMPFLPRGAGFAPFDPMQLATSSPDMGRLHVWLDADEQDPWRDRNLELHTRLDARGITNELHVWPGRHGDTYWHDHVDDYLGFYGRALASP